MSVEAISWALNDAPDIPPQCMAVLIGLANHAHANGRAAYPSQERLAHYARKSVRSVQRDLDVLLGLGVIRRGDQRHTAFLPADRRPVVYDLVLALRRTVPDALDVNAEPQSGKATEPVDNRDDVHVAPVDRGDVHDATTRRTRPNDTTPTSYEPSLNHKEPKTRASARVIRNGKNKWATPEKRGVANPPGAEDGDRCGKHPGQLARSCAPCRSELLGKE
jgi:hypothetical protein